MMSLWQKISGRNLIVSLRRQSPAKVSASQQGFTLIEIVIVIVVMSASGFAFLSFFMQSAGSINDNYGIQTGIQFGRECMEQLITLRRYVAGYAGVDSTICDNLPAMTDFTRSVTLTPFDNTVNTVCPLGVQCQTAEVAVSHKGNVVSKMQILLTDY